MLDYILFIDGFFKLYDDIKILTNSFFIMNLVKILMEWKEIFQS